MANPPDLCGGVHSTADLKCPQAVHGELKEGTLPGTSGLSLRQLYGGVYLPRLL